MNSSARLLWGRSNETLFSVLPCLGVLLWAAKFTFEPPRDIVNLFLKNSTWQSFLLLIPAFINAVSDFHTIHLAIISDRLFHSAQGQLSHWSLLKPSLKHSFSKGFLYFIVILFYWMFSYFCIFPSSSSLGFKTWSTQVVTNSCFCHAPSTSYPQYHTVSLPRHRKTKNKKNVNLTFG